MFCNQVTAFWTGVCRLMYHITKAWDAETIAQGLAARVPLGFHSDKRLTKADSFEQAVSHDDWDIDGDPNYKGVSHGGKRIDVYDLVYFVLPDKNSGHVNCTPPVRTSRTRLVPLG